MTRYYLEVLKDNLSIDIDTDVNYHHPFKTRDIIPINMYSTGAKVVLHNSEYDAIFTLDWTKTASSRWSIAGCITKGYLRDITIQIERDMKLNLIL
jgi:hypothetical protein